MQQAPDMRAAGGVLMMEAISLMREAIGLMR